jgi:hypothetical protein
MPTREETMYFCFFCDYRDDRETCSLKNRFNIISKDLCEMSKIYGIPIEKVTKNSIEFDGQEYKRHNIGKLIKSISNF